MRLTVLGCRAGMPADGQASSGYLVGTASTRVLLDCGPMHGLKHAAANCGTRIDTPAGSFAYTGDTAVTDELHSLAREVVRDHPD